MNIIITYRRQSVIYWVSRQAVYKTDFSVVIFQKEQFVSGEKLKIANLIIQKDDFYKDS